MAAVPPNVEVTTIRAPTGYTKTVLRKLWLDRIHGTQDTLLRAAQFGHTVVNNWAVFEGEGAGAKLVARGQGIALQAGAWMTTIVMVFVDGRFKGSTLQVMGNALGISGQLSIMGGTGQFALATGTINVDFVESVTVPPTPGVEHLTVEVYTPIFSGEEGCAPC